MTEPLNLDDIPELEAALRRLDSDALPSFIGAAFQRPLLEHEIERLRGQEN